MVSPLQSFKRTILHLCADTGSDTWPYRNDPRYEVITVGSDIGVENYYPDRPIHGIIANPVCTEFSVARMGGDLNKVPRYSEPDHEVGLQLVDECIRIIEEAPGELAWWVIENPGTGALHKYMGKPDYSYEPWWYGSPWTKRTALWGKFNTPPRKYYDWDDVPNKIPGLYVRRTLATRVVRQPKPGLSWQHKSAWDLIPEFNRSGMPRPGSDMEFRSLCSQKFARAFKRANP